jgi:hypothetical protein
MDKGKKILRNRQTLVFDGIQLESSSDGFFDSKNRNRFDIHPEESLANFEGGELETIHFSIQNNCISENYYSFELTKEESKSLANFLLSIV